MRNRCKLGGWPVLGGGARAGDLIGRRRMTVVAGLALVAAAGFDGRRGKAMEIKRAGSRPSGKGPAEYFTGAVRVDPLFEAADPGRVRGASVTFEPGARTAWHTHPLGQTLVVTAGRGWAQREGGPVEEIRPGDVVWFPAGEKHWHGATPATAMTHIAIQEALDGKTVDWMEKVSDEQYRG
jgi:quercetin dioxygenase-like cupin family protein